MGLFNRGYATSLRGFPLQALVSLCSAWVFTLFGYDQGVMGGLISTPEFLRDIRIDPSNADLQGTVVAIYDIGCLTGCLICAVVGDRLGRRMFIIIGGLLLILGASLQAGANATATMIAGRVIAGIGTGLETSFIPIWVSECARAGSRGALIAAQLTIVVLGLTIAYWFDYGVIKNYTGSIIWKLPVAFQLVFVVLTYSMILFLPESPRYLYAIGEYEDADDVVARIYNCQLSDKLVERHREDVLAALRAEKEFKFRFKDIFFDESPVNTSWRIWLGIIVQFLQQMDGNNVVSYYATFLFINSLGMSQQQAAITSGGVTLLFLGGTATTIYTVERLGRRFVMLWGAIFCSIFMILFTIGLAVNTPHSQVLAVVSIFLFEFFFGASWCPLPWIYAPEINPLHVRHIGTSLAVGTEWLVTFIVVKWCPLGIKQAGWKFYLLFCVFNVIAAVFTYFCVKETKGLTLEEIDLLFAKPEHKEELEARLRHANGGGLAEHEKDVRHVEAIDEEKK